MKKTLFQITDEHMDRLAQSGAENRALEVFNRMKTDKEAFARYVIANAKAITEKLAEIITAEKLGTAADVQLYLKGIACNALMSLAMAEACDMWESVTTEYNAQK